MDSLKTKYDSEIKKELEKEFGIGNIMAVPRVKKVVINMGVGDLSKNKEARESFVNELAKITGQKPSVRAAKVSVSGFGVREGMPVGIKVTLRGRKMYSFLERLFSIVLPRLRDFRGVPLKSFDKMGNYTLGIKEFSVFPEIDTTRSLGARGLEITIVTNAKNKKESISLLEKLGMPFEKN